MQTWAAPPAALALAAFTTLTALTPLASLAGAASAEAPLTFTQPAEYEGRVEASRVAWVAVYFMGDAQALHLRHAWTDGALTNRTAAEVRAGGPAGGPPSTVAYPVAGPEVPLGSGGGDLSFGSAQGRGFLLVEARSIRVRGEAADGQAFANTDGRCGTHWLSHLDSEGMHMRAPDGCEHQGAVLQHLASGARPAAFTLEATGLTRMEWHNLRSTCPAPPCLDGARPWSVAAPDGSALSLRPFNELRVGDGGVWAEGAAAGLAMGAAELDLSVSGSLRLPSAQGETGCRACFDPGDRSFAATGDLNLRGLAAVEGAQGRLQGSVGGRIQSARLDESPIDPALLGAGLALCAGAAVGGGLLLPKLLNLLSALLVKPSAGRVMEHPRRKVLYAYVKAHPGATFRELARNCGMHLGTARHHLGMLKRAGLVDERRHRMTLRFFENHGRFAASWRHEVLLREPALRELRDWLAAHPGAFQKDVLDAMARHGWARSTAQHRLQRLVDEGLAAVQDQGRFKRYCVLDAPRTSEQRPEPPPFARPLGPRPLPAAAR